MLTHVDCLESMEDRLIRKLATNRPQLGNGELVMNEATLSHSISRVPIPPCLGTGWTRERYFHRIKAVFLPEYVQHANVCLCTSIV